MASRSTLSFTKTSCFSPWHHRRREPAQGDSLRRIRPCFARNHDRRRTGHGQLAARWHPPPRRHHERRLRTDAHVDRVDSDAVHLAYRWRRLGKVGHALSAFSKSVETQAASQSTIFARPYGQHRSTVSRMKLDKARRRRLILTSQSLRAAGCAIAFTRGVGLEYPTLARSSLCLTALRRI